MSLKWWEWPSVRGKLETFARAIQGAYPYRVIIETDRRKCPTGYCDFSRQVIAVNPTLFGSLPDEEAYLLTRGVLAHEAGERRWREPSRLDPLTSTVANLLGDETLERFMMGYFAGLVMPLTQLAAFMYRQARPVRPSDDPSEVVSYFLQLRWAERIGEPIKGSLSAHNQALWREVEPLVRAAWEAESSAEVDEYAGQIVDVLKLKEIPEWLKKLLDLLGKIQGERGTDDGAERGKPGQGKQVVESHDEIPKIPTASPQGPEDHPIEPKPFLHLVEAIKGQVDELIQELSFGEGGGGTEASRLGGRFSVREYLHDRTYPFLVEGEKGKAPPTLTWHILIDHSTSMNQAVEGRKTRMDKVAEAVMLLHLVSLELAIPHQVSVTPDDILIADGSGGEAELALIAGIVPALTSYEDMGKTMASHAEELLSRREDIRLMLCLTDAACNDWQLGRKVVDNLKGKVEVIGILLDADDYIRGYGEKMFGRERFICVRSGDLAHKLGAVIRNLYGV